MAKDKRSKITNKQWHEIVLAVRMGTKTQTQLSKEYPISESALSRRLKKHKVKQDLKTIVRKKTKQELSNIKAVTEPAKRKPLDNGTLQGKENVTHIGNIRLNDPLLSTQQSLHQETPNTQVQNTQDPETTNQEQEEPQTVAKRNTNSPLTVTECNTQQAIHENGEKGELSPSEAVDLQVSENVEKVSQHLETLGDCREIARTLMTQLNISALHREEIEETVRAFVFGSGDSSPSAEKTKKAQTDTYNRMMAAVSLPSHSKTLTNIANALAKIIPLERQAMGMDERKGVKQTDWSGLGARDINITYVKVDNGGETSEPIPASVVLDLLPEATA